jgi:hypothetical protein
MMTTTDNRLLDKKVAEKARLYNDVFEEDGKILGTFYEGAKHNVLMIESEEIPRYSEDQGKLISDLSQMEWYEEFADGLKREKTPIETLSAREICEEVLTFIDRKEAVE